MARDPHCAARLETPAGIDDPTGAPARNRYADLRNRWDTWRASGVLVKDDSPAFYLLQQRFSADGASYLRTVFFAEMRLYDFDEHAVIPHERTLASALDDRFNLLSATGVNHSPIFGLFEDGSSAYRSIISAVTAGEPIAHACGDEGVSSRLWALRHPDQIAYLRQTIAQSKVYLADGHHRYTVACAYRDACRHAEERDGYDPTSATDHVMIALSDMRDPQLLVRGYHRAVKTRDGFSRERFLAEARTSFYVRGGASVDDLMNVRGPAFLAVLPGGERFLLTLRGDVDLARAIPGTHSDAYRTLDVTVLHGLIIKPCFQVDVDCRETLSRIRYSADSDELISTLERGEVDAVFIMRPTPLESLVEIAGSGEIMPQKSTYFYPKLPTGMVFREMR